MKIKWTLMMLIIVCLLVANEKNQLARLHYSGGGDWYNDADALPNLASYLNNTLGTDFAIEEATVVLTEKELFNYPFIFLTGHGNVKFSEKEVNNLREYLLRGGFLFVDDDYGMDASFRREIKKIFPEKKMVELPKNHEIFHAYFSFPNGLPKIHKHDDKRPQTFAIFDDNSRMMMLYTYESNISDGWSDAHDNPPKIKENAFKMGTNIFYYLMAK
jgi:hypothetical protein